MLKGERVRGSWNGVTFRVELHKPTSSRVKLEEMYFIYHMLNAFSRSPR